jgi:antitoxin MazE
MKSKIIKIGNSQGVRIPKPLIEQLGMGQDIEILVEENRLVICPADHIRAGWDSAFKTMAQSGDDNLLDGDEAVETRWDKEEWEWE